MTDYTSGFSQQNLACSALCFMSFKFSFLKNLACGAFFSIKNLVRGQFYCSVVLVQETAHADACKPRVSQLIARILQLFVSILTETISEKRLY